MISLAVVIIFFGLVLTAVLSGGTILNYVDIPNIIIIVIIPLLYQWAIFGKSIKTAFSIPFKKNHTKEELLQAELFFKTYNKVTWVWAVIVVLIGGMAIMKNPVNTAILGPNLAVSMISIIYAGIISVTVIIPYLTKIKRYSVL